MPNERRKCEIAASSSKSSLTNLGFIARSTMSVYCSAYMRFLLLFLRHPNSTRMQESNPNTTVPGRTARFHLRLAAVLLALTQYHTDKSDNQPELVASELHRGGMYLSLLQSKGATKRTVDLSACGNRTIDHHGRWRNF